jgi:hypothetical protein
MPEKMLEVPDEHKTPGIKRACQLVDRLCQPSNNFSV